jgi:hypothetical protein
VFSVQCSALPLAAKAASLIQKETVSIHRAVELVEIQNNKQVPVNT